MKLRRILPIAVGVAVVVRGRLLMFSMRKQRKKRKTKRARAFQDQPAPVLGAHPRAMADVPIYFDAVGNVKRPQHRHGASRRSAGRS